MRFIPYQLISLSDIVKKYPVDNIASIQYLVPTLEFPEIANRVDYAKPLDQEDTRAILDRMLKWDQHLKYLGLEFSLKCLMDWRTQIIKTPPTFTEVENEIEVLSRRIDHELEDLVFGFIPKGKAAFFEQERIFGGAVFNSFPAIRDEIKEAGNCFAMNLNTACVFHLMRAVELAVKKMYLMMTGRKRLVYEKYKRGANTRKSKPIEMCDWNTLIKGLNLALQEMEKNKSESSATNKTHVFYSELIRTFEHLKNGWRNTISHAHESEIYGSNRLFLEGETCDIMRDTRRFLDGLAVRIKDK